MVIASFDLVRILDNGATIQGTTTNWRGEVRSGANGPGLGVLCESGVLDPIGNHFEDGLPGVLNAASNPMIDTNK